MSVGMTTNATKPTLRGTILAVDDEPDILVALEDLLEDEYRVLTTSRPAEALEMIAAERGKALDPGIVDAFMDNIEELDALRLALTRQSPSFNELIDTP